MTPPGNRLWPIAARRGPATVAVALLLVGLGLPFLAQQYLLGQFCQALCLAMAVLGMNLLVGMTGQISLGHAAFYGIGAYATAILVAGHGWPYWAAVAAGAAAGAVAGLVVGIPALRLRGLYLALTTLALGLVFPQLVQKLSAITGGASGLNVRPPDVPGWTSLTTVAWAYYVLLALLCAALVLVRNLVQSRTGRALIAVRDHDVVAESFGVRAGRIKILAFGVSAGLAGLAGATLTMSTQFVAPADFNLQLSVVFIVGMTVGGSTSILGAVLGGLFIEFVPIYVPEELHISQNLTPLFYAAILIGIVYLLPGGAAGGARQLLAAAVRRPVSPELGTTADPATPAAGHTALDVAQSNSE